MKDIQQIKSLLLSKMGRIELEPGDLDKSKIKELEQRHLAAGEVDFDTETKKSPAGNIGEAISGGIYEAVIFLFRVLSHIVLSVLAFFISALSSIFHQVFGVAIIAGLIFVAYFMFSSKNNIEPGSVMDRISKFIPQVQQTKKESSVAEVYQALGRPATDIPEALKSHQNIVLDQEMVSELRVIIITGDDKNPEKLQAFIDKITANKTIGDNNGQNSGN